jgi:chromosome segregation protein
MRLQRLEINGFKSFSDRAELSFDRGVTAIVGPNGCGKSNVADAIVWVMGEQSAKSLRGDRMEDVIFSGSDARKPTAAAEVRLRLAGVTSTPSLVFPPPASRLSPESDGNGHVAAALDEARQDDVFEEIAREVEVTRRLYRSGESEYLINGEICRLRDVHELLMDTGLGAKAYAIIEQGKIGLILSSRPTDRRQLIEEAAGVTKYKARRRAAALKLEAAQQNLTRIDDIIFEVEKQRNALKRQAAKARRYRRLREELRRWEKVLFARRQRVLVQAIEQARARLAEAREQETIAVARLAQIEQDLGRLRLTLAEREAEAMAVREAAHARELEIDRRQQKIAFDRQQVVELDARLAEIGMEIELLESRRGPAQTALTEKQRAAAAVVEERDRAQAALAIEAHEYSSAQDGLEGLEADVEAARSEVFAGMNAATALQHAIEHAASARERASDQLAKLDGESADVDVEIGRVAHDRTAAIDALRRAQEALDATRAARAARDQDLDAATIEHDRLAREVRACEQDLTAASARLASLEELEAARAGYDEGARLVLASAPDDFRHHGSVADYLEVERGFEKAVEAALGALLQYVIVDTCDDAEAGLTFVRERGAGRCGFLVLERVASAPADAPDPVGSLRRIADVVNVSGPHADRLRAVLAHGWIAGTFADAAHAAGATRATIATLSGDVFDGPHAVKGGSADEARGILTTKRHIKELRERLDAGRTTLAGLGERTEALQRAIAAATEAIAALTGDEHQQDKVIVGLELQVARSEEEQERLARKRAQVETERRMAREELAMLDSRRRDAETSIAKLQHDQRTMDDRLATAQRRLFEARDAVQTLGERVSASNAAHAALVERAAALAAEVGRLEEAAAELEFRLASRQQERRQTETRQQDVRTSIAEGERQLEIDVQLLEASREEIRRADEAVAALRADADTHEASIRVARHSLETIRSTVGELDVQRVTAESDLAHLAQACFDAVQQTLEEVNTEVDRMERDGDISPDWRLICGDEPEDESAEAACAESDETAAEEALAPAARVMTPEEAIAQLRAKLDRLGAVNMMAIEQFDELEQRHGFLTTQRKDLVDSIAATGEAIKRIDQTTQDRFREAFTQINENFQQTFSTLFGGGRAGLVLVDETDLLESGIEIIAQPPGKRLQNVQLLSGGEKALTAISLMFAIFRYKPSPFCLLDEIDAPLDDANIGRFIEMLRAMQAETQFILITHNRKTMEIADRLYGVTMEEPGVSKLISVRLN